MVRLAGLLGKLDRRIIYFAVAVALAVPLLLKLRLRPAEMKSAQMFYDTIEALPNGDSSIVVIAVRLGAGHQGGKRAADGGADRTPLAPAGPFCAGEH